MVKSVLQNSGNEYSTNKSFAVGNPNVWNTEKFMKRPMLSVRLVEILIGLVLILLLFRYATNEPAPAEGQEESKINNKGLPNFVTSEVAKARSEARGKYENCSISYLPPPPREQSHWRKPLWVPSFPASGSTSPSRRGDIVKDLINTLTGLTGGMKNFHSSVGHRLKRCYGISETAACSQAHPKDPVAPDRQTNKFHSSVIFVIRNIATAFPAAYTDKAIAYHNATGQVPEDEWRETRDRWVEQSIQTWKNMIVWWENADYYRVALYVPFERLLNVEQGPVLVQKLANQFQVAGFDVAPSEDIPCIWYKAVSPEWTRQDELMKYVPGYTKDQQNLLSNELKSFINEIGDKGDLKGILQEYLDDILVNTKIDKPS